MILTEEQRAAVESPGNTLLRACPGSGKTRVVTAKLLSCLDHVRDTPRRIACITYTNSAVNEIEERIAKSLMPDDDRYFDVATIHSFAIANIFRPFCWRVKGYQNGFKVLTRDMDDFEKLVKEACAEFNYFNVRSQDFEDFANLNIDITGKPIGSARTNEIVARAAFSFWRRARDKGYIVFCNILYFSCLLLKKRPEIADSLASRYAFILVDEFQDTTDLQVEILSSIAERGRTGFFLVGDTYQSIYGFTGARPELADLFAGRISARTDLSLSGNFRSSPPIINDAERLFPRTPPMVAVGKARVFSDPTRHVVATTAIRGILDYFLPALRGLGIPHGEATVLSSSWTPLFPLARALRDQGIKVVGPGARPYRRGRLFAPLAEHLCGYLVDPTPNSLPSIERSLFHVVQEITGRPRFSIFSYAGRVIVLKIAAVAAEIAASDDNALRWLDHASQAIGVVLAENDLIGASQAPLLFTSVQEMKSDMRRSISSVDPSTYRLSDLGLFASPEKALKLSTLHFAKGREFDAVAMINLHEGAIPFFQARTAEDFEEAKRLFYVGVTRPRRLLMYVTDMSDRRNQPTRFLGRSGVGIIS